MTGTRYPSIGRCLYCGSASYAEGKSVALTKEHIIPESLGGDLVFEGASCQKCERITGHVEQIACGHHLLGPRHVMGLPSKKPASKRSKTMPLFAVREGKEQKVEIDKNDFPAALFLLRFLEPPLIRLIMGLPPEQRSDIKSWVHWFRFDPLLLLEKYGVQEFAAMRLDTRYFCRMLAKIAHAFMVAEHGPDGFEAFLPPVITDPDLKSRSALKFIGCLPDLEPPDDGLHTIVNGNATVGDKKFWITKLRLFANLGAPTYIILAGAPKGSNLPPPPEIPGGLDARYNSYRIGVPSHVSRPNLESRLGRDAPSSNDEP